MATVYSDLDESGVNALGQRKDVRGTRLRVQKRPPNVSEKQKKNVCAHLLINVSECIMEVKTIRSR